MAYGRVQGDMEAVVDHCSGFSENTPRVPCGIGIMGT